MAEYLEGGSIPTKKYHKTILEQFTIIDKILYYARTTTDDSIQYTLVVPHKLKQKALIQVHETSGHLGQNKIYKHAKENLEEQ